MGVGPIRGGGNRGGAKGAGKANGSAGGKGAVGKAGGATFGKTDATTGLMGPSGAAGSSEVAGAGGATGAEAIEQAKAKEIAQALKSGEIKSKADAARKLVATILKERMAVQSKALETLIAEKLIDDPRLQQTLERIWQKGG